MGFTVRKIEIAGDPAGGEAGTPIVRLIYADAEFLDDATEWLQVQVQSQANHEHVLAEVGIEALSRLQQVVSHRILVLESLRDARP